MYGIVFSRSAGKALRKTPRDIAVRIRARLDRIATDPYARHANVSRLRNRQAYRLRLGDWRVIYEIHGDGLIILVVRIGPRGEAYR